MLTNDINIPFEVHAASILSFLRPLIIQVGVKSFFKKFQPALLSPPNGPPGVLFC